MGHHMRSAALTLARHVACACPVACPQLHRLQCAGFPVSGLCSCVASVYEAIKVEQVPPTPDMVAAAAMTVETWAPLGMHPALSVPRAAFASNELDDVPALVIAHDFYPCAQTLQAAHLQPVATPSGTVHAFGLLCLRCM